jgi:rod shape-determining protein MreD
MSLFSNIKIFGVVPDLVFVYIVCYSIIRNEIESVFVALFTGIIRDSFFPGVFGINTIVFILTAYLIGFVQKRIYKDSVIVPMLFTFISTYAKGLIYYSYLYLISYKFDFVKYVSEIIMLESLFNSLLSIILFKMILKYDSIKILRQDWKF